MKTIYLVRHAKSDWENTKLLDIERPLNERGYSNANSMSLLFKEKRDNPGIIISSPAIRAFSTASIFAKNLNYDSNNILIKKELYESSVKDYLSVVTTMDEQFKSLMLFAHNPTISSFADSLCNALPMEMSTCTIVGIRFDCKKWSDIKTAKGELFLFEYPKR
jgi:phosphohistidine phosphatase